MELAESVTSWHRSRGELEDGLSYVKQSPANNGVLYAIVVRPRPNRRLEVASGEISPLLGLHGDRWAAAGKPDHAAGGRDRKAQVTLMNSRAAALFAQTRDRWALAGDQLYVDLDLSDENLQPGDRLSIGLVMLEVSDRPHLGCAKFSARFGQAALELVNSAEGRRLHLRGLNASVVQAGSLKVGDLIVKCGQVDR